jgi:hypothetical protein
LTNQLHTDPAHYLSNLIPQGASLHRLPASTIATYLQRSVLSQSTIALAACVIDSLSSFFVRTWCKELSALSLTQQCERGQPMFSISQPHRQQIHGSATPKSALIVLAALSIASGFLDDVKTDSRWWARKIAGCDISARELSATVRCVLKDIDYDILSFTPDVVEEMRDDMFPCAGSEQDSNAGSYFPPQAGFEEAADSPDQRPLAIPQLEFKHTAIVNEGLLTPELSPTSAHKAAEQP